jgi:hypothetical protein
MAKSKPETIYTWDELQDAIIEGIEKQRKITALTEELNMLKKSIKETMFAEKLKSYKAGPDQNYGANLVYQDRYSWQVDSIKERYPTKVFNVLCPPTPNSKAIKLKIEELQDDPKDLAMLMACAKHAVQVNLVLEDPLVKIVETTGKGRKVGSDDDE